MYEHVNKMNQTNKVVDVLQMTSKSHCVLFFSLKKVLTKRLYHTFLTIHHALKRLAQNLQILLQLFGLGLSHNRSPLMVKLVQIKSCCLLLLCQFILFTNNINTVLVDVPKELCALINNKILRYRIN